MKKFLCVIMVIVVCFAFCSCGSENKVEALAESYMQAYFTGDYKMVDELDLIGLEDYLNSDYTIATVKLFLGMRSIDFNLDETEWFESLSEYYEAYHQATLENNPGLNVVVGEIEVSEYSGNEFETALNYLEKEYGELLNVSEIKNIYEVSVPVTVNFSGQSREFNNKIDIINISGEYKVNSDPFFKDLGVKVEV